MEFGNVWITVYILLLLFSESGVSTSGHDAALTYTRDQLLMLRAQAGSVKHHIPRDCAEILRHKRQRKAWRIKMRGSRGGVRKRLRRRGSRFPLPTIMLSKVQSLNKKIEELTARMTYESDFKLCNLICLTETWLKRHATVSVDGC